MARSQRRLIAAAAQRMENFGWFLDAGVGLLISSLTMDTEQAQEFNDRLNHWISRQGLWFQLRHSAAVGGGMGGLIPHLVQLGVRFLVLLLILVGIGYFVVSRQVRTERFQDSLEAGLTRGLHAESGEISRVGGGRGSLGIGILAIKGGEKSFFHTLEASGISCARPLQTSFTNDWSAGVIKIQDLDIALKSGAEDPEGAAAIGDAFFGTYAGLEFDSIEIDRANVRWGNLPSNQGQILNSKLVARRASGGWRLEFSGGTFSQGWIRQFPLLTLTAICSPGSVDVVTARLLGPESARRGRDGGGTGELEFSGLKVTTGALPEVDGTLEFSGISIAPLLPMSLGGWLEGSLDGKFRVFGSCFGPEGIGFRGDLELGENSITLWDKIPLLRALSVIDAFNDYRQVTFDQGRLSVRIYDRQIELSQIDLKAGDLLWLEGSLLARQPTFQESRARAALEGGTLNVLSVEGDEGEEQLDALESEEFSLQRIAREQRRAQFITPGQDSGSALIRELNTSFEQRLMSDAELVRAARNRFYEGKFAVSLRPNAFVRAPGLIEKYPVNPESGRIELEVEINGGVHEITRAQADALYIDGKRGSR